jgi:hypothetical protein
VEGQRAGQNIKKAFQHKGRRMRAALQETETIYWCFQFQETALKGTRRLRRRHLMTK